MAPRELSAVAAGAATGVTTVRSGGAGQGWSAAETSFASDLDRWKNRGRTSEAFSGVRTFESSATVVKHRRPSRSGSTAAGYFWMSSAALFR